ncbi:FAD-dependent monooxygenase [Nocardia jiangxiensis]|uniref:FAD-dependent monooxygenase n=1 Tax=Nocardia jiangxiensis TaxID=282685 RepID=A0ABW6RSG3_9NOCA
MYNERILISGAGIAGQATAYWLSRFGFRPTVVERAPGLRLGGQGVDVREHAIEVIERMGLTSRVRAVAADVRGMQFVDTAGESVARIDIQRIKEKIGSTEVEIMRGDLVRMLHEISSDSVEYRFGDAIRALDQDADGVTVTFEHARPERFDLVVGADGLHSATRRLAFGPEEDFVRHMDHYFAFGDADAALGPDRWVTFYNTPGTVAGIYRSGNHSGAKVYLGFRSPRLNIDLRDPSAVRGVLIDRFGRNQAWHVPQLLDNALADGDLFFDSLAQVRMSSWSAGRVVLVGDAAYCASPVSGAGAELALTGGYRLAGELTAANGEHRPAFDDYERAHRPVVAEKHRIGPNVRLMIPRTRLGIATRNTIARLPVMESLAGMERIMAPRTPTPLPDYRAVLPGL